MLIVGVDGCPGGWLAVAYNTDSRLTALRIFADFSAVIATYPDASCIAVDIPIGLLEGAPRGCDVAARALLGPRRSSVFPAPDLRLVDVEDYDEASARSRMLLGKGISRQAFGIYRKVAEVNRIISAESQDRVIEIHPEVSFWWLSDRSPMQFYKGTPEGFEERQRLLSETIEEMPILGRQSARRLAPPAGADDVLDAIVAAWTAERFVQGRSERLPAMPETDARGRRVEINY